MPNQPAAPATARHDMSVILVTGSYDHEIRFWEAWSGICSRTISRSGESGVRHSPPIQAVVFHPHLQLMVFVFSSTASQSSRNLSRVRTPCIPVSTRSPNPILYSKRLLAAAIHKKVNIYEIASSSSTPVIGSSIFFHPISQARKNIGHHFRRPYL